MHAYLFQTEKSVVYGVPLSHIQEQAITHQKGRDRVGT